MDKHIVTPENAAKLYDWLIHRGGLRIWHSINLSNPNQSYTTPADKTDKPHWSSCDIDQCRLITDPAEIVVQTGKEVKRFHVAIRQSSNGLMFKCTDGSTERIRKACDKAGKDSWYEFDYFTQEAVIFVPDITVPIKDWMAQNSSVMPA